MLVEKEIIAVRMLTARNNGVSAISTQRRRCPAPHRKMKSANRISSATTFLVTLLVSLGNLHNPIRIWTGMEKYASAITRSMIFIGNLDVVLLCDAVVLFYVCIRPWIATELTMMIRRLVKDQVFVDNVSISIWR